MRTGSQENYSGERIERKEADETDVGTGEDGRLAGQ
jgi:hypothetical protein